MGKQVVLAAVGGIFFTVSLGVGPASAAVIFGTGSPQLPPGSSATVIVQPTVAPNNDNSPFASPNLLVAGLTLSAVEPSDLQFSVVNSGGTTEYFLTQSVTNLTAEPWTDFHFELGFGTGTAFVRSPLADFLDFDDPTGDPAPTSSAFSIVARGTDTIDWSGGFLAPGDSAMFTLSIDVPDNLAGSNLPWFTLRLLPTTDAMAVPEPMSLASFGIGLLGFCWRTLSRRRRS